MVRNKVIGADLCDMPNCWGVHGPLKSCLPWSTERVGSMVVKACTEDRPGNVTKAEEEWDHGQSEVASERSGSSPEEGSNV